MSSHAMCKCGHPANAHERGGVGRCINCGRHGKPGCGQFRVKALAGDTE